jgi:DNA-binding LacI/PurR family transcriptional regulator
MVSPKYARVQNGIVNLIATENIKTGEMLPTEKKLSEHFDVSIITIRRAVRHLEENKIVRREQGRGTFVITDIQGKVDNGTIAFLDIVRGEFHSTSFSPSVKSLDSELARRAYRLNVQVAGQKPDVEAISRLKDARGVIVTGWVNPKWVQILNALDMPMVFLGGINCDPLDIPMVSHDYRQMATMLAQKLFEEGAKKIGLILGGSDYAPSALMKDGLVSVLKRRGERLDPSLIYYSDDASPGSASISIGKFLSDNPEVDGFLMDSACYVHVLNNLFYSRRRPLLGVMSAIPHFNNVCRNTYEAAFKDDIYEKAIELLVELIHSGDKSAKDIKLEPYLVKDELIK